MLVLIKHGASSPKHIRVRGVKETSMVAVEEGSLPVTLKWIEEFLELLDYDGQQSDRELGQLVQLQGLGQQSYRESGSPLEDLVGEKVHVDQDSRRDRKGKRVSVKAPKRKPSWCPLSNSNAKLILEKKKGVSESDSQLSLSSFDSGRGTFVNSIQDIGECSIPKTGLLGHPGSLDFSLMDQNNGVDNGLGLLNLEIAQDRGLCEEGLLIDFF
ncbi:hypothetical protein Q3G72_027399 [Acer saccharum]|nr:hypothetical protein Q3G72_027399 [Acer saccharum]